MIRGILTSAYFEDNARSFFGSDFDVNNQIIAMCGSNGLWTYTYDTSGILTSADKDDPGDIGLNLVIDSTNRIIFMANHNGGFWTYTYDTSGILTSADHIDPGGSATGVDIDTNNNLVFFANHNDGIRSYSYDTSGILTSAGYYAAGSNFTEDISVDKRNNLLFLAKGQLGIWSFTYNNAGSTITSAGRDTVTSAMVRSVDNDDDYKVLSIAHSEDGIRTYTYYPAGSILTSADHIDPGSSSYDLDMNTNDKVISIITDANGIFLYSYNHLGKLSYISSGDIVPLNGRGAAIDSTNRLVSVTSQDRDIDMFTYNWPNGFYANINNSYISSGNGYSATPLNTDQLGSFFNGLSAISNTYIGNEDILKIKGSKTSTSGSNIKIFSGTNVSNTITSWENKVPWFLKHTSGYVYFGLNVSKHYLTVEDAVISKLKIFDNHDGAPGYGNGSTSATYNFNNCIIYDEVKTIIISGDQAANTSINFNGCNTVSANIELSGYDLPA